MFGRPIPLKSGYKLDTGVTAQSRDAVQAVNWFRAQHGRIELTWADGHTQALSRPGLHA